MTSVKVKFRPSTVTGKMGSIYYQVIHGRMVRQISTNYKILSSEWNQQEEYIIDPRSSQNRFSILRNTWEKIIIRKTKCFDFWERNVLFPKTKRSFFRTPKHPLPCPFPLNFSLLIITKKFGNLAKNRYICIV